MTMARSAPGETMAKEKIAISEASSKRYGCMLLLRQESEPVFYQKMSRETMISRPASEPSQTSERI